MSSFVNNVPTLTCPITGERLVDPVIDHEGNTYERSAIEEWIARHHTSPITRNPLELTDLRPNRAVLNMLNHSSPSVPTASSNQPPLVVACTAVENSDGTTANITVDSGEGDGRVSADVVAVVDVSGSMSSIAEVKSEDGSVESDGLTLLDIVCHACRTVVKTLGPNDRFALVTYSDNASTIMPLTKMDDAGQQAATTLINTLTTQGCTNLWDGLKTGMDIIKDGAPTAEGRTPCVMLLTDGLPNINPPRGILGTLERYRDREAFACTVHTFGFGYSLDGGLLDDIAKKGDGSFSFIPDPGMVGTIFVHTLSNLLCTRMAAATLYVEGEDIEVLGGLPHVKTTWGATVSLGSISFGHPKSVAIKSSSTEINAFVKEGDVVYEQAATVLPAAPTEHEASHCRALFVDTLGKLLPLGASNEARNMVKDVIGKMERSSAVASEAVTTLMGELKGQVSEVVSRQDWFNKWGGHYLRSLGRAHAVQECNNFKDDSVQEYAKGTIFTQIRDLADDIFLSIPAPKPKPRQRGYAGRGGGGRGGGPAMAMARTVSMSTYHSRSRPCVAAECRVSMADGSTRLAGDLKAGDEVVGGTVKCVVDGGPSDQLWSLGSLLITEWHPVRMNGVWAFPSTLGTKANKSTAALISVLLEDGASLVVEGVDVAALGHELEGSVIGHPFLGDRERVWHDLAAIGGDSGYVKVSVCRGDDGLVCGFKAAE